MFLTPGGKMQGKKGRLGRGDTSLIACRYYGSSGAIIIPAGATRANVTMVGAGGGGGMGPLPAGCPPSPGGTGGRGGPPTMAKKLFTNLVPGETLTLTIGAGGAGTTGTGGTGGTTSLASGSCAIPTLQVTGAGGGAAGPCGGTGAAGGFGSPSGYDYIFQQGFQLFGYYWGAFQQGYGGAGSTGSAGASGYQGFVLIDWLY